MLSRADLKQRAKDSMSAASLHPVLAGLIFLIISLGITGITNVISGVITAAINVSTTQLISNGESTPFLLGALAVTTPITFALSFVVFAVTGILNTGFAYYCLRTIRHQEAGFETFFYYFKYSIKVFGILFMTQLFIFLWSLLFVFPGIIASYRYRMAIYIFIDNPEKGVMECINESKYMMSGHKGELFVLDLSFILWSLLIGFTCGIASIYVFPYIQLTNAVYYDNLNYICKPGNFGQQMGPMGGPAPMNQGNQFNQGNINQQQFNP